MATPRSTQPIASVEELRKQLPAILEAINESGDIALRAALNPLLALEELGYLIDPQLRPYVERRVRFEPEDAERLGKLEAEVHEQAGRSFDLDEPQQLARVLFLDLDLGLNREAPPARPRNRSAKRKAPSESKPDDELDPAQVALVRPLDPQLDRPGDSPPDPLAALADDHPVMRPLLEYRRLEAKRPRLATAEQYAHASETGEGLSVTRLRVQLRKSRSRTKRS